MPQSWLNLALLQNANHAEKQQLCIEWEIRG